jgi:YD repeat-containing protein
VRSRCLRTNDNGNVLSIANCRESNRTGSYAYDALNRIVSGQSTGANWGDSYVIDAWGNLTNMNPISGKAGQNFQAAPASTKNQLSGFCHDAAGNLVLNTSCPNGTFTPTYTYDAENRLVSTAGWSYVYDGNGQRVERTNGATGTLYWRNLAGDVLDESDLSGNQQEEYVYFGGQKVARRDIPASALLFLRPSRLG